MMLNVFLYLSLERSRFELVIWGIQLLFLRELEPTAGGPVAANMTDQSGNKDGVKNVKIIRGL